MCVFLRGAGQVNRRVSARGWGCRRSPNHTARSNLSSSLRKHCESKDRWPLTLVGMEAVAWLCTAAAYLLLRKGDEEFVSRKILPLENL